MDLVTAHIRQYHGRISRSSFNRNILSLFRCIHNDLSLKIAPFVVNIVIIVGNIRLPCLLKSLPIVRFKQLIFDQFQLRLSETFLGYSKVLSLIEDCCPFCQITVVAGGAKAITLYSFFSFNFLSELCKLFCEILLVRTSNCS